MKSSTSVFGAAPWLALAIAAGAPAAAQAQAQAANDGWRFGAAIYGWFPAISGQTAVPVQGGGANIDVSMADVVDALKFAFMGSFEARKGQWGLWTDLVYADFGASKSGSRDFTIGGGRPVGVNADLQLDIKSWIWTVAGMYSLAETPQYTADLVFGARYIDLSNDLGWTFDTDIPGLPGRSGSGTAEVSNWDGIVGLKGRAYFGDDKRWFVPYYGDIGTGQSKLTWQVNAGVGYQFDWGAIIASWRYLDYDFKSSAKVQDLSFSGPLIGVVFKF
jgi:hypothetical protein